MPNPPLNDATGWCITGATLPVGEFMLRPWIILSLALITGCTTFPDLDGTVPPEAENAPFPMLQPVDPILENTLPDVGVLAAQSDAALARVAGLQARAARLRARPVIDRPTRARLLQAISSASR